MSGRRLLSEGSASSDVSPTSPSPLTRSNTWTIRASLRDTRPGRRRRHLPAPPLFRQSHHSSITAFDSFSIDDDDDDDAWSFMSTPGSNRPSTSWPERGRRSSHRSLASHTPTSSMAFQSILPEIEQQDQTEQELLPSEEPAENLVVADCRPATLEDLTEAGVVCQATAQDMAVLAHAGLASPEAAREAARKEAVRAQLEAAAMAAGVRTPNSSRSPVPRNALERAVSFRSIQSTPAPYTISPEAPSSVRSFGRTSITMSTNPVTPGNGNDDMDEAMRVAIEVSLREEAEDRRRREEADREMREAFNASRRSSAVSADLEDSPNRSIVADNFFLSDAEKEAIEKALREADEAEQAASVSLALELQEQEQTVSDSEYITRRGNRRNARGGSRALTRHEYEMERASLRPNRGLNDLYSQHDDEESIDPGDLTVRSHGSEEWPRSSSNPRVRLNGTDSRTSRITRPQPASNNNSRNHLERSAAVANASRLARERSVRHRAAMRGEDRSESAFEQRQRETQTLPGAMDDRVRVQITRAIKNGLLGECNEAINNGEHASIYHATPGSRGEGFDVAIKVFRRNAENLTSAVEEYRNLIRASRSGVPVPKPLITKENILFMKFLGKNAIPAPKLKYVDIPLGSRKWNELYLQTVLSVRRLFQNARLVHGDLSEYNILLCSPSQIENAEEIRTDGEVQIALVDFRSTVHSRHEAANDYLFRDIERITSFFKSKNIRTMNVGAVFDLIRDPSLDDGQIKTAFLKRGRARPARSSAHMDETSGTRFSSSNQCEFNGRSASFGPQHGREEPRRTLTSPMH